ncbi:hypothetical protein K4L44_17380 [Halosquirtibacter laminarini]|uniref:Uncharacterized protein n=1 Tax=Halosquirtibacter laminarini TaxID=3374600 RepID=A0AC61NR24_9BACT|nr:hypothetical protein K4L44_17380 [Prolixibacteraceae bacterium]
MRRLVFMFVITLVITSCSNTRNIKFEEEVIRNGKIVKEVVDIDFVTYEGGIESQFLNNITCTQLNGLNFRGGTLNGVEMIDKVVPYDLLAKDIKPGTPTYYTMVTAYHFIKASRYYAKLISDFQTIDHKKYKWDKDIHVSIAENMPMANNNSRFIFSKKLPVSPSSIYHKVGHRFEKYLKQSNNIVYKQNRYIGIGMMEYFTCSLNNSPKIFEGTMPEIMVRDISKNYLFPIDSDKCSLYTGIMYLKTAYSDVYNDENSSMRKYIDIVLKSEKALKNNIDTHSAACYISHPLWSIRESIGAEKADKLIMHAWILLGKECSVNSTFYTPSKGEKTRENIEWYTVLHALTTADKMDNQGKNIELIRSCFATSNLPVGKVAK